MIAANHVVVLLHRRHAEVLAIVLIRRRGGIPEIRHRIEAVLKRDSGRVQPVGRNPVARKRLACERVEHRSREAGEIAGTPSLKRDSRVKVWVVTLPLKGLEGAEHEGLVAAVVNLRDVHGAAGAAARQMGNAGRP